MPSTVNASSPLDIGRVFTSFRSASSHIAVRKPGKRTMSGPFTHIRIKSEPYESHGIASFARIGPDAWSVTYSANAFLTVQPVAATGSNSGFVSFRRDKVAVKSSKPVASILNLIGVAVSSNTYLVSR